MPGVVQPLLAMKQTIARTSSLFDKTGLHVFHRLMKIGCSNRDGGW
jgi:hypothetical protein